MPSTPLPTALLVQFSGIHFLCVSVSFVSVDLYDTVLWKRKLWWLSMRKLSAIPFSSSAFVVFSLVCYGCWVLGMFTSCHFCWHTITPFWAVLVISVFWGLCSMEGKLLFLIQCTARDTVEIMTTILQAQKLILLVGTQILKQCLHTVDSGLLFYTSYAACKSLLIVHSIPAFLTDDSDWHSEVLGCICMPSLNVEEEGHFEEWDRALLQQLNKYPGGARTLGLLSFKTAETSKQQPKQQVKLWQQLHLMELLLNEGIASGAMQSILQDGMLN